ncbi:MAG: 1-acyl-sn-glycerol-3-phosphate acyltransferase [Chloroflexi bacterium]|nr:1-acyl-sn-glycerol-3-phosphate acyltransferase [Anaerolineae bacterium]RLC74174.1 MAG: 1-acyl-sn-glycerol-3-phosphate acyltransferase [Chloroflexota bacterium]
MGTSVRSIVRRGCHLFLAAVLPVLLRLRVFGRENVPASGPLIVVCNHISHFDALLLVALLPWPIESIAVADLWQVPVTGWFIRLYGAIPLHRGEGDRAALRAALDVLARGDVLGIAPEGYIVPGAALVRPQPGAAYLALRSKVPLLPVGIAGTERALENLKHGRRTEVTVRIGEPFMLSPVEGPRRERLRRASDEIMEHIAALLPVAYRGVYAGIEKDD